MKQAVYIIGLLLFLFSCNSKNTTEVFVPHKNTANPNDILLKNETVSVLKGDSMVKREGDSLNGRIHIQNGFGKKIIEYKDGWVTSRKSYKSDSVMTSFYNYLNGELNGFVKEWHDNGILKLEGHYSKGMADSIWTYYYRNGNPDTKGRYNPNYKIKDFEKREKNFDSEHGNLVESVVQYDEHSAPDGVWEFYSFSGQLIKTLTFDKGTVVSIEFGTFDEQKKSY